MSISPEELEERLARMEAALYVQSAELTSMQGLLAHIQAVLGPHHTELSSLVKTFFVARNRVLQSHLELLETRNPALAARLQELIDQSSRNFPFRSEDDGSQTGVKWWRLESTFGAGKGRVRGVALERVKSTIRSLGLAVFRTGDFAFRAVLCAIVVALVVLWYVDTFYSWKSILFDPLKRLFSL